MIKMVAGGGTTDTDIRFKLRSDQAASIDDIPRSAFGSGYDAEMKEQSHRIQNAAENKYVQSCCSHEFGRSKAG
jgi:hypothetical protein